MLRISVAIAIGAGFLLASWQTLAGDGALDPTLVGGNGATSMNSGTVILPALSAGSSYDAANTLLLQPDGKILVAGRSGAGDNGSLFVARLYRNGALDTGFGFGGVFSYHSGYAGGDEVRWLVLDSDGSLFVGANLGSNNIGVLKLLSNGVRDTAYGIPTSYGGSNHLSMTRAEGFSGTFVGTYDGSGHKQIIIGGVPAAGAASVSWQSYSLPPVDRDVVPTALAISYTSCGVFCLEENVTVAGYADLSDISGHTGTNCMIAQFGFSSLGSGTIFAVFKNPYTNAVGCYFDNMTQDDNGNFIAVGRELFPGQTPVWEPSWMTFDPSGSLLPQGSGLGGLTSSGDNSLRNVLIQSDGKWIFTGFTGVDASGLDGFVAGRLPPLGGFDASWDTSYGNQGTTLFSIDPVDESYGYSDSQSFASALDRYGRAVMVGTVSTGLGNDNQVNRVAIARLQSDLLFDSGFEANE